MPKQDALIFEVFDITTDKVAFTGTAKEISELYGLKYPNVYRYRDLEYAFRGKYLFKEKETYRRLIKGINLITGEFFVGDIYEVAEIFSVKPQNIKSSIQRGSVCFGKYKFDFVQEGEEF